MIFDALKKFQFSLGTIPGADSSCLVSIGKTEVSCALNGPVEERYRGTKSALKFDISVRTATGIPSSQERHMESCLVDLANRIIDTEFYGGVQLLVGIELISHDGSVFAAVFNAFYIAVLDLGLRLRTRVLAVSISSHADDRLELLPNSEVEHDSSFNMTLLVCLSSGKIVYVLHSKGSSLSGMGKAVSLAQEAALNLNDNLSIPSKHIKSDIWK